MRRPFLIIFIILLIVSFIYTNTNAINTDYGNEDIEISANVFIEDKFIKENNGTFNIKIKDKKVEAKKIKGECDLHLSINTFTQLAFSYIDIKEAMILNNINKNEKNKEVIDLFEILFNKKENYINEYV